jgi:hypothetical protein
MQYQTINSSSNDGRSIAHHCLYWSGTDSRFAVAQLGLIAVPLAAMLVLLAATPTTTIALKLPVMIASAIMLIRLTALQRESANGYFSGKMETDANLGHLASMLTLTLPPPDVEESDTQSMILNATLLPLFYGAMALVFGFAPALFAVMPVMLMALVLRLTLASREKQLPTTRLESWLTCGHGLRTLNPSLERVPHYRLIDCVINHDSLCAAAPDWLSATVKPEKNPVLS